jgi:hypothetical protein
MFPTTVSKMFCWATSVYEPWWLASSTSSKVVGREQLVPDDLVRGVLEKLPSSSSSSS